MSEEEAKPRPWEKQTWETSVSFHAFVTYYINQSPPRSSRAAYARYQQDNGKKAKSSGGTPGYWNRWVQGRDVNGVKIPGALSWQERAGAYDAWLQDRVTEERIKRSARISVQWEDVTSALFRKFKTVVEAYDPTIEGADLMTLVSAMEKLYKVSSVVFGFQAPMVLELGKSGEAAAKRKALESNLTVADRLQALADIFQKAAERNGHPSLVGDDEEEGTQDFRQLMEVISAKSDLLKELEEEEEE